MCEEIWTTVTRNTNKKKNKIVTICKRLEIDDVIEKIKELKIYKLNPYSLFICGSVARKTNKDTSDLDLLVIWKNKIPKAIIEIREELEYEFNTQVDLVSMIYRGKLLLDTDVHNIMDKNVLYLNNVILDAYPIKGCINDIYESEYILKV